MSFWSLRIPRRFLRGSSGKLVPTVIALACGVALVCAIDLVNRAVLRAFVEVVDTMAGRAALQVTAGEGGLFPEDVATIVSAVPGVELAVPVVSASAFTTDDTGELLTVHGVDIGNEAAVRVYDARDSGGLELDDPLIFLAQPDSVVLTRAFAGRRGLRVGDQLTLVTPAGRRAFTVRGLLEPDGVARVYGGNLVVMDLYAAEAAFTRPGLINKLDVVVGRDRDVDAVAAAIRAMLPPGLGVAAPAQRKTDIHRVMQSLQVGLAGVGLVALVSAFLIAFNRLSTLFEGRMWQLGILRAVGARTGVVWLELVKESLVLGAAGVIVGVPLGIAIGYALLPVIATTTALNYKLILPDARLIVSPTSLAIATGLGFGAALLAAALPAWRAAGSALAETVRRRGLEQPESVSRSVWLLRVLVIVGIAGAIVIQSITRSAEWGLVATGLIAVGTALAARPFLRAAKRPIDVGLNYLPRSSGRFAARALARNSRRAALTIAMLGVGVGSVLWVWTMAHSFEASVIETLSQAFQADLVLSSSHVASGFDDAPTDGALVEESRAIPGVQAAVGERILDWTHRDGPIAIDAFDPAYFRTTDFGRWRLLGRALPDVWDQVARGDGVIVSTSFVHNIGASVGDTIRLETPNGPLPLVVAGVTSAFASPRGTLEMSRAVYERYWRDGQVTRVHLKIAPGIDRDALRATIARRFGDRYRLRILSAAELMEFWTGQVRRAFSALHVVAGMVLLVILLGMADTLGAEVADRTRELGTLRAVGGRRLLVRRMILTEGMVLGVLGLILAVGTGLALGVLWVDATFPLLLGWALDLHIPYGMVGVVSLVTMVVCVLAAVLPARQAARLEPAVALRYE